ncbi:ATPase, histidine kinase-, DNA gyrase B (macronuclear) [Tetrahymena thermophila SB210]|uniref:ATPase, histidine kinase-, DNA gyrase B n=1 Tax=Tetrahymena thermophila (strain SB210) TaxID=312017 RepID=I7LZE7_TETTS|nr:ATPase, histidine kinase-, DNA gyrase B [Tetrahymena thermophila SB210]EAR83745.2 ATPase, histidine kinase-, DNA gyrase B [Tetrahymena thermophila SB210]|eukprot:XP_001031408.2 ATPase, histidine kinase-, DNA gyrase B [Tetrahymena thermophila SB210]
MNKFTLSFEDLALEKEFFWWSYNRDYFIIKVLLGSIALLVQFPSIIISINRGDNLVAMGWGVLMVISLVALVSIKYKPLSYNMFLSLYHLLIMFVNIYYLYILNSDISNKYGAHILFVYALAHGTSHSTVVMLGTNFLLNSMCMVTAYLVYAITFLDYGFTTFHLFLIVISLFTIFGKYMRDRSQREMFLMRERETKWLNIMKKALPSSIILVQYNEKLDKIDLDLVNQNAKNCFQFNNNESFSEFSRKMQLEKYINFDLTLSNSNIEKFINVDLVNQQINNSSLQQYISSKFREISKDKKINQGKSPILIQNLKQIKSKSNNEGQEKVDQSNSLSNFSKQLTQNQQNFINQPSNFFQTNDQRELYMKTPQKISNSFKKTNSEQEKQSAKGKSQNSTFGVLNKKKKNANSNNFSSDKESILIETFVGLYKSSDDQQLRRYKVKVIHYNVGQYFCLIVIEDESDEEKIQFLKKQNRGAEQIVQKFIDNTGKNMYKITEQLRDNQLKEIIFKKNPIFLKTLKYESSILYNSIYNIRSHFLWAKQKVRTKCQQFSIQAVLDEIYDTFSGNPKALEKKIKFFISKDNLSKDNQNQLNFLHSDLTLIKQLFYSLIQNSFENTDKGYIVLKLTEIPGENELSTIIKVEVTDSGRGFENILEQINQLLNVQNPQFSEQYYGSICFGLKNSQRIVRVLGPYSKLFIFTRNGKGSKICFYIYQNMSVFSQSNNHIQFQNQLFQQDLDTLKNQYKNEQKMILNKEQQDEESSFLGFENVTQINIKELEEDRDNLRQNEIKQITKEEFEYNNISDIRIEENHKSSFGNIVNQSKLQIIQSPTKKFLQNLSSNLNQQDQEESYFPFINQIFQNSLKNSNNTNYSTSNTQINIKNQKEIEDRKRHYSLQEDNIFQQNKERSSSIFKKLNNESNFGIIIQNDSNNQNQNSFNPYLNNSGLDYVKFSIKNQDDQKAYHFNSPTQSKQFINIAKECKFQPSQSPNQFKTTKTFGSEKSLNQK